jgi:glycolate oxidase
MEGKKEATYPYSLEVADLVSYSRDQMSPGIGEFMPENVVMPGSVEEVQEIVRIANEDNTPLYPCSFGTNFSGYTLPDKGGILLDLRRLDRILEINEETMTATIEPGVNWGRLRREAQEKGLLTIPAWGPYSGGMIGSFVSWNVTPYATRFGSDRIVSLEVVLPNGELLRTASAAFQGHEKSNPYFRYAYGPDITGLFRGSVGALGIVTKAVVRLYPIVEIKKDVSYGFGDLTSALTAMRNIERIDITKFSSIMNNRWTARICDPNYGLVEDPKKQDRMLEEYPEWILTLGFCGRTKQVAFYEELVEEECSGGKKLELTGEKRSYFEDFIWGAGKRVVNIFGVTHGAFTTVTMTTFSMVPKIWEKALETIKEMDFRDPVTGASYKPTVLVGSVDRGMIYYFEVDYDFISTDQKSVEKAMQIFSRLYPFYAKEMESSLGVVAPPWVWSNLMPTYRNLVKTIKKTLDPKGIFAPGKLFAGEE